MKFNDKREEALKGIVLENTRVDYSQPIIFLCGGFVGSVTLENPEKLSVRRALMQHLNSERCELAKGLTIAENYQDWLHDSIYRNLIEFETDIAQISSLIVICLESSGAITELGLFVKNPVLQRKLLVFVSDDHYQRNSFIRLGPLRYLESKNEASVCAYPWDNRNVVESLSTSFEEMRQDIKSALERQDDSEQFDRNNHGHVGFVIFEFVKTFKALKITEIAHFLNVVGLEVRTEQVKRLLFLLERLDLIGRRKRGHTWFYYACSDNKKINFGGKFDEPKVRLEAQQFYIMNDSEKARVEVIKSILPKMKEDREAVSS